MPTTKEENKKLVKRHVGVSRTPPQKKMDGL